MIKFIHNNNINQLFEFKGSIYIYFETTESDGNSSSAKLSTKYPSISLLILVKLTLENHVKANSSS